MAQDLFRNLVLYSGEFVLIHVARPIRAGSHRKGFCFEKAQGLKTHFLKVELNLSAII